MPHPSSPPSPAFHPPFPASPTSNAFYSTTSSRPPLTKPLPHANSVCRPRTIPSASVRPPDSFNLDWYQRTVAPLVTDISAHFIPNPEIIPTRSVDHHFIHQPARLMALIDYSIDSPHGPALLDELRHSLLENAQLYGREAQIDLRRALSTALLRHGAPPGFSAMAAHFDGNLMRVVWTGACGIILIRDDNVYWRSYQSIGPRESLENVLHSTREENQNGRKHWLKWGGTSSVMATGGYIDGLFAASVQEGLSVDCKQIQADFIELEDNDLIIAGSDGFFANVSEQQILAFVRPVPDPDDKTLAIANNTCLGSWRKDDVEFISYYLASIGHNFATANHSAPYLPFPFPPSPHVDDITVLSAAVSFQ